MPFKTANFTTLPGCRMYAGEDRELENQLLVTRGFLFPSQIRYSASKLKRQMFENNQVQVCFLSLEHIFPLLSTLQFNIVHPFTHYCLIKE